MTRYCFDIETDGLLASMTQTHCLWLRDDETNETYDYADQPGYLPISAGLERLSNSDRGIGHNVIGFDVPALKKCFPKFSPPPLTDTLILSRLQFPDIYSHAQVNARLPRPSMSHGLAAWGDRMGLPKDKYTDEEAAIIMVRDGVDLKEAKKRVWETWNVRMHSYCGQDTNVTRKLYRFLKRTRPMGTALLPEVVAREHRFAELLQQQHERGWEFDYEAALDLYSEMTDRVSSAHNRMLGQFPGWWRKGAVVVPEASRKVKRPDLNPRVVERRVSSKTGKELKPYIGPVRQEIMEGCPYTKTEYKPFNPGSRQDCIEVLKKHYGWKPSRWTEKGFAKMDEAVLEGVKDEMPLAKDLIEFYMLRKRLGQLGDGRMGWIKHARPVPGHAGRYRMHGSMNSLGTATHRCTHSTPNMGQVPASRVEYGPECRSLFIPSPGMILVGSDADALEMRMLAHYLQPFDGGDMIRAIESGSKEDGTDPHSRFRDLIGTDLLGEGSEGRDKAKTLRYAIVYGAGAEKQGKIIKPSASSAEAKRIGAEASRRMSASGEGTPALIRAVKKRAEDTGHIKALDGRMLPVRAPFAALNTLLQSAGAIYMKEVLIHHDRAMTEFGEPQGERWGYVGNIHDEFQAEVHPDIYLPYRDITLEAYLEVGRKMGLRCPMRGSVDRGMSWKETH